MNSEELWKRFRKTQEDYAKIQEADKIMFQTAEHNMDAIINESLRVSQVAHHAESTLNDLDEQFRTETKLNNVDIAFLFTAIGLQVARQYLLTKFPPRLSDQEAAESTWGHGEEHSDRHHWYYNPSLDTIITNPVPFDANVGANGALSGGGKMGHRVTAIGHDPLLGLIFGTANIATSTLTTNTFQSYHIGTNKNNRDYFKNHAKTSLVLSKTGDKLLHGGLNGKAIVGASLIKELIHLRSDLYTKNSLPLPVVSALNPRLANTLASYGLDMANIVTIGKQVTLSALINALIAMVHGLFYDETGSMSRNLYEVKTRKILCYSSAVASASNLVTVAFTQNLALLDLGGIAVMIYRLITDTKFIRQVKHEFVYGNFNKLIQGDALDLKDYSYDDILKNL